LPKFVSIRFAALSLGMKYMATVMLLRRSHVRPRMGKLYAWADVAMAAVCKRKSLLPPGSLQLLAKFVDPEIAVSTPAEVPADVLQVMREAWGEIGSHGSDLLVGKAGEPSQPQRKAPAEVGRAKGSDRLAAAIAHRDWLDETRLESMRHMRVPMRNNTSGWVLQTSPVRSPLPAIDVLARIMTLSDAQLRRIGKARRDDIPIIVVEIWRDMAEAVSTAIASWDEPVFEDELAFDTQRWLDWWMDEIVEMLAVLFLSEVDADKLIDEVVEALTSCRYVGHTT
jgi:hypothetical protein